MEFGGDFLCVKPKRFSPCNFLGHGIDYPWLLTISYSVHFICYSFTNEYCHFLQLVGSLVAHMGSGVSYEVSSSLDIMISLTSNNSEELIPISSHITGNILSFVFSAFHLLNRHINFYAIGILDYLESFHEDNLRKVCDIVHFFLLIYQI